MSIDGSIGKKPEDVENVQEKEKGPRKNKKRARKRKKERDVE